MDGGVERETRGRASIHGEWCIFFGFHEMMKRRKSSVKMTRGLRGEGEKKSFSEICKICWDGKGKRRAASLNEGEAEKAREVPNADL